jgi:hypothetical protein
MLTNKIVLIINIVVMIPVFVMIAICNDVYNLLFKPVGKQTFVLFDKYVWKVWWLVIKETK